MVDAVALHWHPITAAECAERTRLDVNVVSAQLNRLVKLGLLAKVSLSGESRLGFQLVERFFNIWYLMRASRRARQRLIWFVEFLRMFYSEEELARRAQALLDRTPGTTNSTHVLAVAAAVPDLALRRRLECRAVTLLVDELRAEPISEILDLGGADAHLSPVLDRARTFKELRARLARYPKLSSIGAATLRNPIFPLELKIELIDQLVRKGPKALAAQWNPRINTDLFGEELLAAIERGEVPSMMDVATVDEAGALLALARHPEVVATVIIAASWYNIEQAYGIVLLRFLLSRVPDCAHTALVLARLKLENDQWPLARALANEVFQRLTATREQIEPPWTLPFLSACVQHKKATEVVDLFTELGLHDRWLPLYEALRIASGERERLDRLAPEVRMPTAELVERLQQSGPTPEPNPEARTPPKRPRSRKRIVP
jgi:hypothetical protein